MAQRVTPAEVQEIIDTTIALDPFITAANLTVDQHLLNHGLSAALLKEIERWLAAHLAAMRDPRASAESLGDASSTYEGQSGLGLDPTRHGPQGKGLAPTGTLATLGAPAATLVVNR